MTNEDRDRILQDFLDSRSHKDIESFTADWPEPNRTEIASLIDVAELLWEAGHEAPPLEADPVAAMLGLIPDPRLGLDPRAMSRARKNAKLKPSDIAGRLQTRGWDIAVRDVFQWENQTDANVAPALIKAISEALGVSPEELTIDRSSSSDTQTLASIVRSARFEGLARRWARLQGVSHSLASSALQSRMLATVHRGDRPDQDQMLQSLDALITAMEERDPNHGS
ncbi:hypothetical protein Y900_028520 [Mycolicibacterium aromaticivorans JS19b1 = JCM 16368]|uniref:HTH cro/C1-type domain-containing protein n=1 Tax=Mycolicibacterium aromaticivorans JS19b1 = JCM 16368 TaxID=1440774 RepID=A0A064CER1_9MYCO|nr:hypothetical protein [Mycolicibacterium aromaticivorans]KDE97213.1 hypothetical protein Y900_028520 [Mycolicibacterium aromaticivorans JS19b1 = JCM 16368]